METPIGEDEDASIGDLIEDVTVAQPIDEATKNNLLTPQEVFGQSHHGRLRCYACGWNRYEYRSHTGRSGQAI